MLTRTASGYTDAGDSLCSSTPGVKVYPFPCSAQIAASTRDFSKPVARPHDLVYHTSPPPLPAKNRLNQA